MKKTNIITSITVLFIITVLSTSCENNSTKNNSSNSQPSSQVEHESPEKVETIDGVYSYKDNSAELVITINGSSWSGKTMMITGFGSDYDNQNAQYDNGIVKGNDLYESSGMVKVGYVNGNSLTTSVGGQSVTLQKN